MLDTNMLSDVVRRPRGSVGRHLRRVGERSVVVSIMAVAEAKFGAAKSPARGLGVQLESVLARIEIVPFDAPADQRYAELRAHLQRAGTPIGANDLWIAAHALALDCTLVTDNEREFRRVPGLRVENWLA